MQNARLLLLTTKGEFKEVQCGSLDDFYKHLECDCFDIAHRKVGGKKSYDIFVDDMGLLKDNPIPTALDSRFKPMLVGNLIFANHDNEGNTTSLSDEDIEYIKGCKVWVCDTSEGGCRWVAWPIDY